MKLQKIIFFVAAILAFGGTTQACEPILPSVKVVGGPGMLRNSWTILLAAVAIKSIIFSASKKKLSFVHASLLMIAGNVLTTFRSNCGRLFRRDLIQLLQSWFQFDLPPGVAAIASRQRRAG